MSAATPGDDRLDAIVGLLDDDSPRVADASAEHFLASARQQPQRVRAAIERGTPRQRVIGRRLLELLRVDQLRRDFERLAARALDLEDLERGALLLASWRYPALDTQRITATLDQLATDLEPRLPANRAPRASWSAIRAYLFESQGFAGNHNDYYNPDNSYLNRVLELRRGIPISLSALVLFLARRLDLPMVGVGLPSHFLVRFTEDPGVLLDPFHAGRLLTRDDCVELFRAMGQPFDDRYLDPTPPQLILARMIRNLIGIYDRSDDGARAKELGELIARLGVG